jgi:WD40 repeat protein
MSSIKSEPHDGSICRPHNIIKAWENENDACDFPVAYHPDGLWVVTGCYGTAKVWNLESGGQVGIAMEHEDSGHYWKIAVTGDDTKIVSASKNWIKVWDAESHALVEEWSFEGEMFSLAISPDDRLV